MEKNHVFELVRTVRDYIFKLYSILETDMSRTH